MVTLLELPEPPSGLFDELEQAVSASAAAAATAATESARDIGESFRESERADVNELKREPEAAS
jgi:hypothetical protein